MLVNIYKAKSQVSALLEKAQAGEEIVIARAGKPVARLTHQACAVEAVRGLPCPAHG